MRWPNGRSSEVQAGGDWLVEARSAGVSIPTGCLGGSCGACEIEVNGELLRACISSVPNPKPENSVSAETNSATVQIIK